MSVTVPRSLSKTCFQLRTQLDWWNVNECFNISESRQAGAHVNTSTYVSIRKHTSAYVNIRYTITFKSQHILKHSNQDKSLHITTSRQTFLFLNSWGIHCYIRERMLFLIACGKTRMDTYTDIMHKCMRAREWHMKETIVWIRLISCVCVCSCVFVCMCIDVCTDVFRRARAVMLTYADVWTEDIKPISDMKEPITVWCIRYLILRNRWQSSAADIYSRSRYVFKEPITDWQTISKCEFITFFFCGKQVHVRVSIAKPSTGLFRCMRRIRQHTLTYISTRQHTSSYVSIRQDTSAYVQHPSIAQPSIQVYFVF